MNTVHLKYAVEVERVGSITQAADNLFMAQPNLSKAIKELEDILGIVIFKRTPKGMVPTKKGAEFLVYAKNILDQIDKMEHLNGRADGKKQSFKISIPRASYISESVSQFLATLDCDKAIDVNFQETNSMNAVSGLVEGLFNLAIIRYPLQYETYFWDFIAQKSLKTELIWEFEPCLLLSKSHPLADKKEIFYADLKDYIQMLHGDISVPYLPACEAAYPTVSSPQKKIYVYERASQFDLLTRLPRTYIWVSPVPKDILEKFGLVMRKCKDANRREKDMLLYQSSYALSTLDRQFLDRLSCMRNAVAFAPID